MYSLNKLRLAVACACSVLPLSEPSFGSEILLANVFDVGRGESLRWSIDEAEYAKLPKYRRDGGQLPVSLQDAIKIAENYCRKVHKKSAIQLDLVSFQQSLEYEKRNGVYFYFISFEVSSDDDIVEFDVLVLPNKSILQPKLGKKQGH